MQARIINTVSLLALAVSSMPFGLFSKLDAADSSQHVMSHLFVEKSGLVSMEAEHASQVSNWTPLATADASGVAMVDQGGGSLAFTIKFNQTGRYYVWFRHKKPEGAKDLSNDCFVHADNKPLKVYDGTTEHDVIGLGTHKKSLTFESRPKTHEKKHRAFRPFLDVNTPGVVRFVVASRSPGYILDKIVLLHTQRDGDNEKPKDLGDKSDFGPPETAHRQLK